MSTSDDSLKTTGASFIHVTSSHNDDVAKGFDDK